MEEEILIKIDNVKKEYPGGFCLGPVSLELYSGTTIAFLGKNGAGKSTFFQLLTGNSDASSGSILLGDKKLTPDKFELKRELGYLPQNLHLPKWATCLEILRYGASLYQLDDADKKITAAIEYWDCSFFKNKPLAACSHGMQKRVGLAIANLHDPACLILDEPFSGLDLFHTKALETVIKNRQDSGKTTLISTHIAPYVAQLCQKVYTVELGSINLLKNWDGADYLKKISLIEDEFFSRSKHNQSNS
ncbi:MAG: ABC transporter ATP-binding protein [Bdellovibrionota bacterium]